MRENCANVTRVYIQVFKPFKNLFTIIDANIWLLYMITIYHNSPEVASTVANRSILPHSDWLASADRSKPIIMPYLPIFATVSFNVTVAKIGKYSAMIGLLRLDHVNRSKPIRLRQLLRFTTARCYFRTM